MDIGTMRAGVALGGDAIRIIGSWPALLTITLAIAAALRGLARRRAVIRARRSVPPCSTGDGEGMPDSQRLDGQCLGGQRPETLHPQGLPADALALLDKAQSQMIHRLRAASALRDNETAAHTDRVGQMARHLALLAGCEADFAAQLALAAPLHDVGKIGIPDAILLKPGPLEAAEWDVMKTHTTIGAGILMGSGLPLLDLAAEVALCHHERWNGQGYPRALKETAIPLSGRIVALVDVFDALMSARPYKAPWPLSRSLAYIAAEAGVHFDPSLVRLFMNHIQDFIAIRERDRDEGARVEAALAQDRDEASAAQVIPLPRR